jgi:hypothetical protein
MATPVSAAFAIQALTSNFGVVKHNAKEKVVRWIKLMTGSYKLNVDASFHSDG